MSFRKTLIAAAAALVVAAAPASAKTMRFAFQGDYRSLDPYSLNETFTLGMLAATYEGLTQRGPNLEIQPALAERWDVADDGKRWRFYLRKGVKFQKGEDFTADDVIFSADRVRMDGSDLKTRVPKDAKFVKVDDHTLDVILPSPAPTLNAEWDTWYIMSKKWAEANNAASPTPAAATTPSYAALNANGTGPFVVESHQAGVKTVWKPNAGWWNDANKKHNLTEVIFTPIGSDATRVAALLSGEVDWIDPVPLQDVDRVNASGRAKVLQGPELRTIFLGFDQTRDELKYSNVKGKNPFKDVRVRKAVYQAIDINAIKDKVMRGASTPSALMISPILFSRAGEFQRFPYDVDAAKKLLAEAGYPQGFEVGMDCPNDRYVNDERICQAVVGMLARAGIKVNLNAQPKAKYFAKVLASGGYDTSFYLLGWTPSGFDSLNIVKNIIGCRDEKGNGGNNNLGNYCNPKVEELGNQIAVETDKAKRDELIKQAYEISQVQDVSYVPLHQQALAWGVSNSLKVVQRADNEFLFYWATKD
ncbi:MAG TPA: ABC transporter substrate-binding protein [Beijerinckiaceae bacterium]|jgi:peptide/nickel transport system substrate-binding protein